MKPISKLKLWLYKHLRNPFVKLEQEVLQAYEYDKAEKIRKKFREGMTPELYKLLITRPDQNSCEHRKGGGKFGLYRSGTGGRYKDYAILVHTFSDARTEVKCTICGKKWDVNDPEAKIMMKETTNTRSSSEVHLMGTRKNWELYR